MHAPLLCHNDVEGMAMKIYLKMNEKVFYDKLVDINQLARGQVFFHILIDNLEELIYENDIKNLSLYLQKQSAEFDELIHLDPEGVLLSCLEEAKKYILANQAH